MTQPAPPTSVKPVKEQTTTTINGPVAIGIVGFIAIVTTSTLYALYQALHTANWDETKTTFAVITALVIVISNCTMGIILAIAAPRTTTVLETKSNEPDSEN